MVRRLLLSNQRKLIEVMKASPGLRFIWPLQEVSGAVAYDYTENGLNGTIAGGVNLAQPGPGKKVPLVMSGDGLTGVIAGAAGCSVRGLGSLTMAIVAYVVDVSGNTFIFYESVGDNAGYTRLGLVVDAWEKLTLYARSGTSAQAASSVTLSAALAVPKFYLIHATIDIATNAMKLFINGLRKTTTGTPNFGGDTIIADTAPLAGPNLYKSSSAFFAMQAAFFAQWARVLSDREILNQAKAGGFAS